jgi:hypothetical protein
MVLHRRQTVIHQVDADGDNHSAFKNEMGSICLMFVVFSCSWPKKFYRLLDFSLSCYSLLQLKWCYRYYIYALSYTLLRTLPRPRGKNSEDH